MFTATLILTSVALVVVAVVAVERFMNHDAGARMAREAIEAGKQWNAQIEACRARAAAAGRR